MGQGQSASSRWTLTRATSLTLAERILAGTFRTVDCTNSTKSGGASHPTRHVRIANFGAGKKNKSRKGRKLIQHGIGDERKLLTRITPASPCGLRLAIFKTSGPENDSPSRRNRGSP